MKVISSIRIGDTKILFNDLTDEQKEESVYKMEMQMLKAIGNYIPSTKWFEEHPDHFEYWNKIIPV